MMEWLCFLKKRSMCGSEDFLREFFRLVGFEVFLGKSFLFFLSLFLIFLEAGALDARI